MGVTVAAHRGGVERERVLGLYGGVQHTPIREAAQRHAVLRVRGWA